MKGRLFGYAFGDTATTDGEAITAVKKELRDLAITVPHLRKADPAGFDLTAAQLDRLREIRGKTARDDRGATMQEALGELFEDEWYRDLPGKLQKREAVLEVIRSFNRPARDLLMERDPTYTARVTGMKAFRAYLKDGQSHMQAVANAEADVADEGLPRPQLRSFMD